MSTESNLSTPPSKRAALTLHCAVPNSTAVFIANWSTINLYWVIIHLLKISVVIWL